jgi:hypothetical protein
MVTILGGIIVEGRPLYTCILQYPSTTYSYKFVPSNSQAKVRKPKFSMTFQQMYLQSMESLRESSELPIELVTSHVTTCPCSLRPALK